MGRVDKHEMAERLRVEAKKIREHGVSNFFEHTYACLKYGQVVKEHPEERCGDCPNRSFVPSEAKEEAFPCQHITPEGWELAARQPDLAERYVEWLLKTADKLDSEATAESGVA